MSLDIRGVLQLVAATNTIAHIHISYYPGTIPGLQEFEKEIDTEEFSLSNHVLYDKLTAVWHLSFGIE